MAWSIHSRITEDIADSLGLDDVAGALFPL
ncbi:MAG: hypothetical protein CM15mP117_02750 [Alphaproteobacteria bacterium]|nr:MAG: hypothetical protein CM15mP117_02750 [Alphaproteobacteria bacterium]